MDRLSLSRALQAGLGQWPPLVALWSLYGGIVLAVCLPVLVGTPLPLGRRVAVVLFLLLLLAAEAVLLVLANGLLELLTAALPRRWPVDGAKALTLAAVTVLAVASLLKFRFTGVHLRSTDLWFAWTNLRQLGAESQGWEMRLAGGLGGGLLVTWLLLWIGLGLGRRRTAAVPAGRLLLLGLLLAGGAFYSWRAYPVVDRFAGLFLPEAQWLLAGTGGPPRGGRAVGEAPPGALGAPIEPHPEVRPRRPWNVVVVMLESIPWSRTPFGGGPAEAAPNLHRLAGESILFDRAYTTSTHSDYAQVAVLSSLHPRKYDRHDYYVDIEYPRTLLWDALAPAGYSSVMFSCQNERWGNMVRFLDTPGLDLLRHSLDWPAARHRGRGAESKVWEETPVNAWRRWLAAGPSEPWLAYLNFQANHFPYEVPPEAPRPFAPHALEFPASFLSYPRERVPTMLNRFYNALLYSDRWLGEVMAELDRRGAWERTVLVVVSDHGEAFYEHAQPTHGTALYEEQVRSLLLVRVPGGAARRIDQPVSLLDVPPLVLDLLGLPPHGNFQGRGDVLAPGYDGAARPLLFTIQGLTREDGLLLGDWKYLVNWDRREARLYHLGRDPGETADLLAAEPATARRLDALLMGLLERQTAYYHGELWRTGRYPAALP